MALCVYNNDKEEAKEEEVATQAAMAAAVAPLAATLTHLFLDFMDAAPPPAVRNLCQALPQLHSLCICCDLQLHAERGPGCSLLEGACSQHVPDPNAQAVSISVVYVS